VASARIALAPLFLLGSGWAWARRAVGLSLTFVIAIGATVARIRSVKSDYLVLSKSLGVTPHQVFSKVTLPSAVPVIFAGFRLGLISSLLGVVGAELLATGKSPARRSRTYNRPST
jgi:NitT/TauT family transport system permease protein